MKSGLTHTLRSTVEKLGFSIVRHRPHGKELIPAFVDPEFVKLWEKYNHLTMVPWQGAYAAYSGAKHVAKYNIPGDIVEAGVWRGGIAFIIAETLKHFGSEDRTIYMYDTYAGMSEPTEEDTKSSTGNSALKKYNLRKKDGYVDWCYASIEEVQEHLEKVPYPKEHFKLVKGKVEDTIPNTAPTQVSLLRVDTDWYESTKHIMEHLFSNLSTHGIFICDDFGKWEGARKAVEEYLSKNNIRIFLNTETCSGNVIGVKE